jgi:YegS/Rv2252/BmrU family lipid kinase
MQVGSRTLIMNPASGSGDHAEFARQKARGKGFAVWETEGEGDGHRLGQRAAEEDVSEVAVCGGDGTINEVLRGLAAADHLDDVTLDVIPAGTANLLAGTLGIRDVRHGFELTDKGEIRSVDVGMADGEPFVVSCIAGFPADASTSASTDLKRRLGTLAFVVSGIQQAVEFDGLDLRVDLHGAGRSDTWEGSAVTILVGNARRFIEEGGQAVMENGLFDVAVVEDVPAGNLAMEAATHRLLGEGTDSVHHFQAAQVTVSSDEPITFSRDGEIAEHDRVTMFARPQALDLRVGPDYEPEP